MLLIVVVLLVFVPDLTGAARSYAISVSPTVSAGDHWVLGVRRHDFKIDAVTVKGDVVKSGSLWPTFSVDLIADKWCEQFIGQDKIIDYTAPVTPISSGTLGGLRHRNLTLSSAKNIDLNHDLCLVVGNGQPKLPFAQPAKFNIIVEYQAADTDYINDHLGYGFVASQFLWLLAIILARRSKNHRSTSQPDKHALPADIVTSSAKDQQTIVTEGSIEKLQVPEEIEQVDSDMDNIDEYFLIQDHDQASRKTAQTKH